MMRASIDTNIIGHLYRSNTQFLITNLFNEILVDEFILKTELRRRCPEIFDKFEMDLNNINTIFLKVTKADLLEENLYKLYELELTEMENLFLPSDEGERRAIALAKSKGVFFLLTDDEKYMSGPKYMIENGIVRDMEALSFWDLIFLNVMAKKITYEEAKNTFEFVASDGYIPDRYNGSFVSKMKQTIKRLKDKQWFNDWCITNRINTRNEIKEFLIWLKQH
jgi:predicted nucleic acid-binding protein